MQILSELLVRPEVKSVVSLYDHGVFSPTVAAGSLQVLSSKIACPGFCMDAKDSTMR
jgi:hypothetical protein